MFCPKCGAQIQDDVKFCTQCGFPIREFLESKGMANDASEDKTNDAPEGGTGTQSSNGSADAPARVINDAAHNEPAGDNANAGAVAGGAGGADAADGAGGAGVVAGVADGAGVADSAGGTGPFAAAPAVSFDGENSNDVDIPTMWMPSDETLDMRDRASSNAAAFAEGLDSTRMMAAPASAGGTYGGKNVAGNDTAAFGSGVGTGSGAGTTGYGANAYDVYGYGANTNAAGYGENAGAYVPANANAPAGGPGATRRRKWPYVVAGVVTAAAIGAGVFFALGGPSLLNNGSASTLTSNLPVSITSAGSQSSGAPDDAQATDAGNSSANFANGANVASVDGHDIYIVKGKGIYRTRKDGSDGSQLLALPSQSDLSSDHLSYLNQDDSKIYYVWQFSTGRGNTTEVHALDTTAAAGSNDQAIYKVPIMTSSGGDISSPRAHALYLNDHSLYLVTTSDDPSNQKINYTVTKLDESGNQQGQSSFTADGGTQQTMSAGKLYYVYTDGQSSAIYSQDLDGSNNQQIYASVLDDGSTGSIGTMAISNGKLYCTERKASDSDAAPSLV